MGDDVFNLPKTLPKHYLLRPKMAALPPRQYKKTLGSELKLQINIAGSKWNDEYFRENE